ncbi:MAG: hypothetical protein LBF93_13095 [Zoogloeaceae bacterium]|jgi:hypothetical protein|nr:hypothetical protein [Zoogloeaceae bacterium]
MKKNHRKPREKSPGFERSDTKTEGEELENLILHSDMTRAAACGFFGISPRTLDSWRTGKTRIPLSALRLARARMGGNLAEIFGEKYGEIRANPESMHLPGIKYPIPIGELRAVWIDIQQAADVRAKLSMLSREHAKTRAAADYYRDLIRREAAGGELARWLDIL